MTRRPPLRRYKGFAADSSRWERFELRPDDVVITTPAKCGTTWMQRIVGTVVFDRVDFGAPISTISPWLDMQVRTEEEVFALLAEQHHRRFIKTHTPLDGLPLDDSVTYIAVIRHPLDVALSDRDHRLNERPERFLELVTAAGSFDPEVPLRLPPLEDAGEFLLWWIDNDLEPIGSGPYGLADYCQQVRTYWDARDEPNVHLFHYRDLWSDREAEMRRVAAALGVAVAESRWPEFVQAAGLESMREHAENTAPEAHLGFWRSPGDFFRKGGTRDWAALVDPAGVSRFEQRLHDLAGDAEAWILEGRRALGSS